MDQKAILTRTSMAPRILPSFGFAKPPNSRSSANLQHSVEEADHVFLHEIVGEHGGRGAGREDGQSEARDVKAQQECVAECEGSYEKRNERAIHAKRNAPMPPHHHVQYVQQPSERRHNGQRKHQTAFDRDQDVVAEAQYQKAGQHEDHENLASSASTVPVMLYH